LLYVAEWNSLQHPVASAFLAAVYSDYMQSSGKTELSCSGQGFSPADLRKFAKSQVVTRFRIIHDPEFTIVQTNIYVQREQKCSEIQYVTWM
jgi:hypothetical protein